jgi:hypothetical protein
MSIGHGARWLIITDSTRDRRLSRSVDLQTCTSFRISSVRMILRLRALRTPNLPFLCQPAPEDARSPEKPISFRPYDKQNRYPGTYRVPVRAPDYRTEDFDAHAALGLPGLELNDYQVWWKSSSPPYVLSVEQTPRKPLDRRLGAPPRRIARKTPNGRVAYLHRQANNMLRVGLSVESFQGG